MPLASINPATGEVLRTFATLDEETLRGRIAQAAGAWPVWRDTPLEDRVRCLRKMAALVDSDRAGLARTISLETGKPAAFAAMEVAAAAEVCRYYADHAARMLAPELLQAGNRQAYVQWQPTGLVLAVLSWESPLLGALRFAVPAIVAGNAVLLKHAASTPQCAVEVEALGRRAGVPRGVLQSLLIEDSLVEPALADDRVTAVTVHGTEAAGRAIAAQAGWLLKKSSLHLPGSDPMVVMPSANMDAAAAAAARALAGGLRGARRIIVDSAAYYDFFQRLTRAVESLKVGDPLRDDTDVGPIGSAEALALLTEQMIAAINAGGRVVTGGTRMVGQGNFFEPTLLSDVPPDSAVTRDLVAGPVAMIFRARDLLDAIALANGTPFGRAASVWTAEPGEQSALIAAIDAGTVALNSLPGDEPGLPAGGTKRSGFGRELGAAGLREFLLGKTVTIR